MKSNNNMVNLEKLNIVVDPQNKETFFRRVRDGSNPDQIALRIRQSRYSDSIIVWNILDDCELSSIDVNKTAQLFYDKEGDCYVA